MSTKIFNGYRLADGVDVLEFADRLNEVWAAAAAPTWQNWLTRTAVTCVDRHVVLGDSVMITPLVEADTLISRTRRELAASSRRNFGLDLTAQVQFLRDPVTGRTHLLLFTELDDYVRAFESLDGLEPYAYWDNTDPDPAVSDEEWRARAEAWDRAIPSGVPSNHGLSLEFDVEAAVGTIALTAHHDREQLELLAPHLAGVTTTQRLLALVRVIEARRREDPAREFPEPVAADLVALTVEDLIATKWDRDSARPT